MSWHLLCDVEKHPESKSLLNCWGLQQPPTDQIMFQVPLVSLIFSCIVGEPLAISSVVVTKTSVVITLKNTGENTLKLWSPNNFEGMNSVSFLYHCGDQRGSWKPPVPPRAGGVATAIELQPGKSVQLLPVDLTPLLAKFKGQMGALRLTAQYSNNLTNRAPVTGVWVGTIKGVSKPIRP